MKKLLLICAVFLLGSSQINAQTTEDFESETTGSTTFIDNSQNFTITNGPGESTYDIEEIVGAGWNGTGPDNKFIDNSSGSVTLNDGSSFTISTTNGADITIKSFYLFVSKRNLTTGVSTTFTFTGKKNGGTVYTVVKNAGIIDGANFTPDNGFTLINLATEGGSDNSNTAVDELIISSSNNGDYLALDAFVWDVVAACNDPDSPTPTASVNNVCPNTNVTLDWAGDALNDATNWHVYTTNCGTGQVAQQTGTSLVVNPAVTTTYFIRGEGGCVAPGTCGQVTVTVDQTTSSITSATASTNNVCPSTSVSLTANGVSAGSGATLTWYTGTGGTGSNLGGANPLIVTPAATTTYYARLAGTCNTVEQSITITVVPLDDATFTYSSSTFCLTGTDPIPTITGLGSGIFSGSGSLSINTGTGEIDLATSGIGGPYTVTYTTTGSCPNSSTINVSITTAPDASFSYTGGPYCATGTATVIFGVGASAGVFSSTTGLNINTASGEVDLGLSTAGTYTVTNDIAAAGGCASASANSTITINALPVINPAVLVGCDSLSYNGIMYYTSTMVNDTTFGGSAAGCDSITNQQITINNTVVVTPTAMVGCDSLSYNGMMYIRLQWQVIQLLELLTDVIVLRINRLRLMR
ncbi:MAG: hypothetical protein JKY54_15925 [Flavobacteriales bacterium]|nr:hypothetical protein [Flavobacteriales bacterium]